MSRRLYQTMMLSLAFCIAVATNVRAKPPETTPCPETEFKVLPPLAQEYYEPEAANATSIFVPLTEWTPAAAIAQKTAESIVNALTIQLARLNFEIAEDYRRAGLWNEAMLRYAVVQKLYPKTTFAQQAAAREIYVLFRIAAEAGEEQSEEPPMAGAKRVEKLTVTPREVDTLDYERLKGYIGP